MVGIRVASLQGEHRCVWWCVQLHDGLHWQRAVDEVRRLIVHILDVYDDPLVVRVCKHKGTHFVTYRTQERLVDVTLHALGITEPHRELWK